MNPLRFYSERGPMTEAGTHASLFDNLPDDMASLCKIVQNNMIHVFWAERMKIKLSKARRSIDKSGKPLKGRCDYCQTRT